MQSIQLNSSRFKREYDQWSYSCHQKRLTEISARRYNSHFKDYGVYESARKNKFYNSKRKEIAKQEKILYENRLLLDKIVQIKSSFYRSSSKQSINSNKSNGSQQSQRSIEQQQRNKKISKDNQIIRQKLSQIQSTVKTMITEISTIGSARKPIYAFAQRDNRCKSLQVQKISNIKLISLPKIQRLRPNKEYTGVTQGFYTIDRSRTNIIRKQINN